MNTAFSSIVCWAVIVCWMAPAASCQTNIGPVVAKAPLAGRSRDLPPIPAGFQVDFSGPKRQLLTSVDRLVGWSKVDFAGGGESLVDDRILTIESGEGLSGVYWDGAPVPTQHYELSMTARRTSGFDFFCGAVFPVEQSHCCLIVGGWGGATVGLSNIDNLDASENDTTKLLPFKTDRWYEIRIRVIPDKIIVWIDDDCVVYQNTVGKNVSLRGDTDLCSPLGLCTYATTAQIKDIAIRLIKPNLNLQEDTSVHEP